MVINHVAKSARIGRNVKVWNFAYVGENVVLNDDISIASLVHVDPNVVIGAGTRISGCAIISQFSTIGKNVFIGPSVTFTNDPYPPSNRLVGITVRDGAVIGAGAILAPGITIGRDAVVAMGSVVTKDVPAGMVVMGNPAKVRYSREEYESKRKEWESGA